MLGGVKEKIEVALTAPSFQLFKSMLLSFDVNLNNNELNKLWELKNLDFDKKECLSCFGKFHKNLISDKGKCIDCSTLPRKESNKEKRIINEFSNKADLKSFYSQLSNTTNKLGLEVTSVHDYNEACNTIINGLIKEHDKYFATFKLRNDNGNFSPDLLFSNLEKWFKAKYKEMPFKLEMFEQAIKEYCEREQMSYVKEKDKFSFIPF